MPTKAKKAAPKTILSLSSPSTRILCLAMIVLLRSNGPLIADQSTVVHQSFYYFQSKQGAGTATMDRVEPKAIQKRLEIWEAAAEAQRRYVEAQGKTSAARLEQLRQEAELMKSTARAYSLDKGES